MSRNRNKRRAKQTIIGNVALLERAEPQENIIPISEAKGKRTGGAAISKAFSLAWDETEAMGITADMRRSGPGMLSDQDRKETLYQAYLNSVWISACVDVIAKRITSGGMVIELTEKGTEVQSEYDTLHDFLHYINEDEDFLQLIRSLATDLLIYGEAYLEIVSKSGKPYSLHKIDCSTMNYRLDKHGQILKYIQTMNHSNETIEFEPDEVIRFWLPDPKAQKKALSPIERILGPTDADAHMADWVRAFFRKGARPPFWIEFPGSKDEASRFVVWLRENYTGQANAHVPMVLYDGAKLNEIGKGSVDMDFTKGRAMMRQEILAGYQVPPAAVSQIESGNIGGGTGESQDKSLISNACDPIKSLIFEKMNYRIVQKGFGIMNWRVTTRYANLQSDDAVASLQDKRIRNGSNTVNEVRAELGKSPVDGGDEAVVVASRDVIPVSRLQALADEQTQQAGVAIQQSQAQLDMTKVQIDKAKNPPPPPPPTIVQAPQDAKKPVPDEKEQQQQERHLIALQQALARTNETLTYLDEHLSVARNASAPDEETQRFKQTLIAELQWLREEIDHSVKLKEEVAELRSLIEAKQEIAMPVNQSNGMVMLAPDAYREANSYYEGYKAIQNESELNTSEQVEDNRPEVVQHHTGMMVAFMLDPETAQELALPDGEPADNLHITLCFLGDSEDAELSRNPANNANDFTDIAHIIKTVAAQQKEMLQGTIGGLGRFTASADSDGVDPIIALVDVPSLVEVRTYLTSCLEMSGFFVAKNHGYTPHITLSYIDRDAPTPITSIPSLPLTFHGITLVIGDTCHYFPFGGDNNDQQETPAQSAESHDESTRTHEDESNRTLYPLQEPGSSNDTGRTESDTGDVESESSNAEEASRDSGSVEEDEKPKEARPEQHWQESDSETLKTLAALEKKGITHLTWKAHQGACEDCMKNDKQKVQLMKPFKSGALIAPEHGNCTCETVEGKE